MYYIFQNSRAMRCVSGNAQNACLHYHCSSYLSMTEYVDILSLIKNIKNITRLQEDTDFNL